jgi:hypothetical protein
VKMEVDLEMMEVNKENTGLTKKWMRPCLTPP